VLKGRNTFPVWVTVAVAVLNLSAGAAAVWLGWRQSQGLGAWVGLAAAGVCILAAVGITLVEWRARQFRKSIIATVEGLRRGEVALAEGRPSGDGVTWAIRDMVDHCRQAARGLQGQLDDLRLRTGILERQKHHTEAILHSLRDAVVVVDESDRVLLANRSAEQLLGPRKEQTSDASLADWLGPDRQDLMEFLCESRKGKGDAIRRQIEWTDGPVHATYDCVACCVRNEQGKDCGVVAVLHDVTRDKEGDQIKNDFVSYVSHELKTPLASITAYAEMLLDGEADDEPTRREFVAVIHGQARRLNRLIEDMLNISRIESGLMPIRKTPLSLTLLVEEQVQMIRSFAEERNVQIVGSQPIVCDQVIADRDMMTLVIVNLLSNAVKYNRPGGSVTIETEVDEVQALARVRVTDTGVGIPADEAEHLFEKFYRAPANARRAEGTGLGLNLVKQIVERLHGGRVFVQSQVGVGSVFGFELPLVNGQTAEVCGVHHRQ
jgi:two-component system, OmpR family, phosphate regulon sensor histidine kinase PhoR